MSSVRLTSVDQPSSGRPSVAVVSAQPSSPIDCGLFGQLSEQAAHQLVEGGRRAGAENPRFGGGLGPGRLRPRPRWPHATERPQHRKRPGRQRLELVGAGSDLPRFAQRRLAGGGGGRGERTAWKLSSNLG